MKLLSLSTPIAVATGAVESINFTIDRSGEILQRSFTDDHPNFSRAQEAVKDFSAGSLTNEALADKLLKLSELAEAVTSKIQQVDGILNGRMTMENGKLFIDGDGIDATLETYILRMLGEDGTPRDRANWNAFGNFVEKLYTNTNAYVREQLFGWLQYENLHNTGFTLAPNGDLIGYKGCMGTLDAPTSIREGVAVSNGVRYKGRIPNPIGAIVTMPRSEVQDDPAVGCSTGLHIGTYDYAKGWARGVLVKVQFSPADVVSVPTECNAQKVRVCRYTVLESIEGPDNGLVYTGSAYSDLPVDADVVNKLKAAAGSSEAVSFDYKGHARSVTVQDVYESNGRTYVLVDDGGQTKTYIVNRMSNVVVESAAKPASAPASTPTADVKGVFDCAVSGGVDIAFTYNGRDRVVTPVEVWTAWNGEHFDGVEDGQHKTFFTSRMSNVRLAENVADNNAKADEPLEDKPQAKSDEAKPKVPRTGDPVIDGLVEGVVGVLDMFFPKDKKD